MYIDKVLYDIITIFIYQKEYITITEISKKIKKSRRIVYYNIDKINIFFKKNNIELLINIPRIGILLNNEQKNIISNFVKNKTYILSKEERLLATSLLISSYNKKITLEFLANTYEVSRNSIISDIKELKSNIQNYNKDILITNKPTEGYILEGIEVIKSQYIYDTLREIYSSKNIRFINFLSNIFKKTNKHLFDDKFQEMLKKEILIFEEKLGKKINNRDMNIFLYIFPYMYISFINNDNNNIENSLNALTERLEYSLFTELFNNLNKEFNIKINKTIILLFTLLYLCSDKSLDIHSLSNHYTKQRNIAIKIVNEFEKIRNIDIKDKDEIINDITTYLKVLIFREKYDIVFRYNNIENVEKEYKSLLDTLININKKLELKINNIDLSNICMYFTNLEKSKILNVLIVTNESRNIKKLLKERLLKYIPNIIIYDTISKNDFLTYNTDNVDLIISTENDIDSSIQVFFIDCLLSKNNILNIYKYILNSI